MNYQPNRASCTAAILVSFRFGEDNKNEDFEDFSIPIMKASFELCRWLMRGLKKAIVAKLFERWR